MAAPTTPGWIDRWAAAVAAGLTGERGMCRQAVASATLDHQPGWLSWSGDASRASRGTSGSRRVRNPRPGSAQGAPAPAAPGGKIGGTLTLAISKDITIINPLVNTNSTDLVVRDLIFEPLLALDKQGRVQPHLAESWEVSADGRSYTFQAAAGREVPRRPGDDRRGRQVRHRLHAGAEERRLRVQALSPVERVEAPDSHTLRIVLKQPSPVPAVLGSINSIGVIPNGSLQEGVDKPATLPPGTGPVQVRGVAAAPADRLRAQRRLLGPQAVPGPRGPGPDRRRQRALHRAAGGRRRPRRAHAVRVGAAGARRHVRGIGVAEAPPGGLPAPAVQRGRPAVRQQEAAAGGGPRRRQAGDAPRGLLRLRDAGRSEVRQGAHLVLRGAHGARRYDLDKARALLREAGYNGEVLEIASDGTSTDQTEATTLQAQLRRAGINTRHHYDGAERAPAGAARRQASSFQISGQHVSIPIPSTMYGGLRCEPDPRKRSDNTAAYCDKDMEAWLDRGESEMDPDRRREIYRQVVAKRSRTCRRCRSASCRGSSPFATT